MGIEALGRIFVNRSTRFADRSSTQRTGPASTERSPSPPAGERSVRHVPFTDPSPVWDPHGRLIISTLERPFHRFGDGFWVTPDDRSDEWIPVTVPETLRWLDGLAVGYDRLPHVGWSL
jgi:hypothetical protein